MVRSGKSDARLSEIGWFRNKKSVKNCAKYIMPGGGLDSPYKTFYSCDAVAGKMRRQFIVDDVYGFLFNSSGHYRLSVYTSLFIGA